MYHIRRQLLPPSLPVSFLLDGLASGYVPKSRQLVADQFPLGRVPLRERATSAWQPYQGFGDFPLLRGAKHSEALKRCWA
jgi:hypothetical protein